MEHGDPGNPGAAFYLLGNFVGGLGWIHDNCGKGPAEKPLAAAGVVGTSLTAGFDW